MMIFGLVNLLSYRPCFVRSGTYDVSLLSTKNRDGMRNKIVLIIWVLLLSNVSFAQLKLATIFADDMVV